MYHQNQRSKKGSEESVAEIVSREIKKTREAVREIISATRGESKSKASQIGRTSRYV